MPIRLRSCRFMQEVDGMQPIETVAAEIGSILGGQAN